MGLAINRDSFSDEDFVQFSRRVHEGLDALKLLLKREDFGEGPVTLGAELEYYIIDKQGNPLGINQALLTQLNDPQLTVELNRFNLEYNLSPQPLAGAPFQAMETELVLATEKLNRVAQALGGRVVPIGILPTLQRSDFNSKTMTDIPRYRALDRGLRQRRGGPFQIDIDGEEPLLMTMDDVTLEGASTSFQVHWRVPTHRFADHFNAVQLVTPLAVALGANSPSLFGHRLWDETRIALFKQSTDSRIPSQMLWRHPPRVCFGEGWVREGAWELFAESAALYPPIIPIVGDEDPLAVLAAGGIPQLEELRLHQGTTWPWNRAIYDPAEGGHLRIEMRALPSGPTPIDMTANAMFLMGAALAVLEDMNHITMVLPFRYAEQNFYRAAQHGIDAHLIWPSGSKAQLEEMPLLEVASALIPRVHEALLKTPLAPTEVERLLHVVECRISERLSPAHWQRRMFEQLEAPMGQREAWHALLEKYMSEQQSQRPICEWSLIP